MADLLDKQHIDAGLDLLRADTSLTVYPDPEGNVPPTGDRAEHYALAYSHIERPVDAGGNSLTGTSKTWTVYWYIHCVGPTEYSAIAVGMRVRAAMLDQRPTIVGRNCGKIRQDSSNPPTRDEQAGPAVYDLVLVYRLTTTG